MASAVTTQRVLAENKITMVRNCSANTSAIVLTKNGTDHQWFDMLGYEWVSFGCLLVTQGTNTGPSLLEIVCADDTSGTNTTVVVSHTPVSAANASNTSCTVGDQMYVECQASQMREVSSTSRYASLRITSTSTADVHAVTVIQYEPKAPQNNLTTDTVA